MSVAPLDLRVPRGTTKPSKKARIVDYEECPKCNNWHHPDAPCVAQEFEQLEGPARG